jgi:hypothetical protein
MLDPMLGVRGAPLDAQRVEQALRHHADVRRAPRVDEDLADSPRVLRARGPDVHPTPRMRAASTAAFRALSTPTAATGTPGGICAIASSASNPSRTLRPERSGTPITGRSV